LRNESVDFIGLRLHAGIRSLQRSRRTLIVAIDNRATEISKDTNLPVVARGDLKAIESWITTSSPTKIQLPEAAIASWKQQFQ
jgi:polysaccharide pyruvyl transferase WcaK-like protein